MNFWTAPNGLHIARGETRDASALAKLHAQGFYRGWPTSDFAAYLADPKTTPAYVATDAKRIISGFAMLRIAGDEAELLTIAVDPRRRSHGLGRALLNAAFADLAMSPVRTLFLEVDETNAPAIALYRRFGFIDIGTRKGYYPKPDGSIATALVMAAPIG
ncbi:ribosomal protein S18-alanine N-acetyltransferase [Pelagibacterium halotolerans]|uniref:Ribosomal-protein-S18p-alanine acetyltransferase n=1 Tax=Pelagibacterium halotolerans (strain DSM 22347 / JCM 15775 / CGMCC 1.7692 / B2) TaxID=1082931 RepID=G4R8I3_PELHB|nr:ribosomal protein S18-alanine N-acetyltransferase [Pelagibacterium halotolerans]AEQ53386.1 ribosomal-protein-S18p-alanine acetyltransferase [Pelagibacterium halotolerans B2]QJR17006.1 ribosomal protein S18-alanine N-acetyltransferase [Pelagibacterium halotolerans]SEA61614.1 ribosomal-protein-alanine N-acetyltransferase [Pelagibacterium halotolerans]